MIAVTIAKRYSRAVVELAAEAGDIDKLEADVKKLKTAIDGLPQLIRGISDERVAIKKRESAVREICGELGIGATVMNLLLLLVRRGRIQVLPEIIGDVLPRISAYRNYVCVDVTVADLKFSDEIQKRIERELALMLGMNVECAIAENKSLLGGFIINVGSKQFDASAANKFERMKDRLLREMR